jgi:tetratricopeptide (TPR) repeat protein
MSPERWERIKELIEAALERPEPERASFLDEACSGDEPLRQEVVSLLKWHHHAGEFMEAPAFQQHAALLVQDLPPSTFAVDEVISGRFQVLRFIGRGGMGEVYEARDLELGARVALKTIRPEVSSDPQMLRRFKQEIQLARRVTHPNVCRLYDLERQPRGAPPEISFLTMEMLEGETLAQRLGRQGRMTTEEALPVVRQMAEALAAAHDVGVVHRDFKPGNVMLVSTRSSAVNGAGVKAVVTDFGLACASSVGGSLSELSEQALSSLSRSGDLVGTLAYMAPEQIEGSAVGPTTDIYALGLVIYEMVTGHRPFQSDDAPAFAAAIKRLKQPPPSPQSFVTDLDPNWEAVILRCLEIDPARRFSIARDVAATLASDGDISLAPAKFGPALGLMGSQRSARRYKKFAMAGLALALIVSLFALALRVPQVKDKAQALWSRLSGGASPVVNPGATVFLTEIKNDTGDPQLNGVTELLRSALGQSAHFNLMTPSRVCEVLQTMTKPCDAKLDPATAREVAMREGVPRVVFGTLSKVSEDYVLNLDIEKPDTEPTHRRQHWTQTFSANSKNDLFDRIRDGSDWVRKTVGEAQKEIDSNSRPLQDITTDSWDALTLLARGREFQAQGRSDEALLMYRQAIERDPKFASAYMGLAGLLLTLGRSREGYRYWQKGSDLTNQGTRNLSPKETLRIRGEFAMDRWDFEGAVTSFATYAAQYPDDYLGYFMRAPSQVMLYPDPTTAIGSILAAQRKPNAASGKFYLLSHLARYYLIAEDLPRALDYVGQLRRGGWSGYADAIEGEIRFVQGNYSLADSMFEGVRKSDNTYLRSASYCFQANLRAERGQYADAVRLLEDGIRADDLAGLKVPQADKLLAIAYLRYRQGAFDASREACLAALKLDASMERSLTVGTLLARSGYPRDAEQVLEGLDVDRYPPISDIVRWRLQGEILMADRRPCPALIDFDRADAMEAKAHNREYLARADLACGEPQGIASRLARTQQALSAYKAMAESPGRFWYQAETSLPGIWSDSLFQYAKLGLRLGDAQAQAALERYVRLRAAGDKGVPDLSDAQALLQAAPGHASQPN